MKKSIPVFLFSLFCIFSTIDMMAQTRLLRNPDISEQHIVFEYAGDIWICNTDGTNPRRLTTFQGRETGPFFSPDGGQICFTAEYDGNRDIYVTTTAGGNPQRLTWHPGTDQAKGWTPDGKVMFASGRAKVPRATPEHFWTVNPDGGFPERLIFPRVANGQFNADASRFAYQMNIPWESEFRHYRGGPQGIPTLWGAYIYIPVAIVLRRKANLAAIRREKGTRLHSLKGCQSPGFCSVSITDPDISGIFENNMLFTYIRIPEQPGLGHQVIC